jgi:hypothetical protein
MRDLGDGISVRPLGRPASMVIVSLGLLDLLDRLLSTVGCPWIRGMALTAVARHRLGNGEAADREQQTNCQRSGCGELALRKRWAHAHLTHYPCRVRRRQPTAMPSTPIPTTSHHAFQKERGRLEYPHRRPILARVGEAGLQPAPIALSGYRWGRAVTGEAALMLDTSFTRLPHGPGEARSCESPVIAIL